MVELREYRTAKRVVVVVTRCGAEGRLCFPLFPDAGSLSHLLSVAPVEGSSVTCKPRLLFPLFGGSTKAQSHRGTGGQGVFSRPAPAAG